MKKLYYLSTCSTCKDIMKKIDLDGIKSQDVKHEHITEPQLDELIEKAGGVEQIFSKRSRQWSAMGLKDKELTSEDLKKLILEEYTFLKRPILLTEHNIYIGRKVETVND